MFLGEHETAPAVVVDAETVDGRHVDPFSEVAAPEASEPRPWAVFPQCMNSSTFYQSYTMRYATKHGAQAVLGGWILRYPERTGRVEDTIVRYSIYQYLQPIDVTAAEQAPVRKLLVARFPDPVR